MNGQMILLLAATTTLIVLGMIGPEPRECQTYNEMRAIYEQTNGGYGWPEYIEGKDEECEK